jgi:hypothetical protein
MFVIDHMPFWVYVITEKGNKIKGLRSKSRFWEVTSLEPTFLPKLGRPVMFVIDHMPFWVYVIVLVLVHICYHGEREQNKRSEEAKRFWEVKSLEPTFLPKFRRTVMFVIDHVTFRVYVITRGREQNKRSEEAKTEFFWEVKLLEPTFLPKFGRPVSSCS